MGTSTDKAHQAAFSHIESDYKQNGNESTSRLHAEVTQLRQLDAGNKSQFSSDLHTVTQQLHAANILPKLDIVETGNGNVAFRGIGEPGQAPTDGSPTLITKSHGTTFTYNAQGEVQSWSKGGDTWTYNNNDGLFHETVNGQSTNNTSSDAVTVDGGGRVTQTHADGSTTVTTRFGNTIDRNAQGQMTKEASGPEVKTFTWNGTQLASMTEQRTGQQQQTYTLASDGKYYAASDTSHQNPISISVEPDKNADGSCQNRRRRAIDGQPGKSN